MITKIDKQLQNSPLKLEKDFTTAVVPKCLNFYDHCTYCHTAVLVTLK